jgi:hypothetical protein
MSQPTLTTPERLTALGAVLADISLVLDRLLAEDILSTNFLRAEDGVRKYVPAYCFTCVREAASCPHFEDTSLDHRGFIDTMISFIERTVPDANILPLYDLRDRLRRYPRNGAAHGDEVRVLHMRRMLRLGWGLLDETASSGLWPRDAPLSDRCARILADAAPPLAYSARTDVVLNAVSLLEGLSLTKEADVARGFLRFNPAIHR